MLPLFLLHESASGYALFQANALDEVGQSTESVQKSIKQFSRLNKVLNLVGFKPYESRKVALTEIYAISESEVSELLANFLLQNLPKPKIKKPTYELGISDSKLGNAIQEKTNIKCICQDYTGELLRGIRKHFSKFITQLNENNLKAAQIGLGHGYSRTKLKFNIHRSDNMMIQAISLLDVLDKDINTFFMRVKEWYSWHFPELYSIISDNYKYCRLMLIIKDKSEFISDKENKEKLKEVLGEDSEQVDEVYEAACVSMGQDISPIDLINIERFGKKIIGLVEYRNKLIEYLQDAMKSIAPNLAALLGDLLAARLIAHTGSLTNLAKCPSSTVQILGAEKALFKALKQRKDTPKYGLLFNSSFITKAKTKYKGKISRFLASKCALATRIDAFMDERTDLFGKLMSQQCEDKLEYFDTGKSYADNLTTMRKAIKLLKKQNKKIKKKKRKGKIGDISTLKVIEDISTHKEVVGDEDISTDKEEIEDISTDKEEIEDDISSNKEEIEIEDDISPNKEEIEIEDEIVKKSKKSKKKLMEEVVHNDVEMKSEESGKIMKKKKKRLKTIPQLPEIELKRKKMKL